LKRRFFSNARRVDAIPIIGTDANATISDVHDQGREKSIQPIVWKV
jgi:hypothetical protein